MVGYNEYSKGLRVLPIVAIKVILTCHAVFNEVAKEYIEIDVPRNNPVSHQTKKISIEQSEPGTSTPIKSKVTQNEFFTSKHVRTEGTTRQSRKPGRVQQPRESQTMNKSYAEVAEAKMFWYHGARRTLGEICKLYDYYETNLNDLSRKDNIINGEENLLCNGKIAPVAEITEPDNYKLAINSIETIAWENTMTAQYYSLT
ncbi:hypothetical protein ROZALSC1DRAFT_30376 [Rozella allomycis CSF55]|uniref:Uncharacterized protein n=1 Tax=Rozella allomycis (strain CSF55) TaxID=988480 RepID=A0A075B249_ROZAC|nr:hypothetical protein O9G_005361 [Rozella allomycis CSF55]RKP17863.1 hypothetical protein ROZALSC1DRAFT_30376 [Rozella allomycis CSF55]|eukprot:EPZ35046.1 hypothetical protein O9G_005361 [Rozella allomycis CSF55]